MGMKKNSKKLTKPIRLFLIRKNASSMTNLDKPLNRLKEMAGAKEPDNPDLEDFKISVVLISISSAEKAVVLKVFFQIFFPQPGLAVNKNKEAR